MASRGDRRRLHLFHKYSRNLELWRPEFKGQYMCPLCLTAGFDEESICGPNPRLTDEHGIQNGLGKPCHILTCADCNHAAGKNIDTHLHKRLEFDAFCQAEQQTPLNIRMSVGSCNLGISIMRSGGKNPKTDIKVIKKQCNEEQIGGAQDLMINGPPEFKLHFQGASMPIIRNSKVALLKSAYLLAFRYFGYGYLLTDLMEPIRQSIRRPKDTPIPLDDVVLGSPMETLPKNVSFITSPEDLAAFVIPIAITKYNRGYMVVLPNDASTYERWTKWRRDHVDQSKIQPKLIVFPNDESFLTNHFLGFSAPLGLHAD
jgi:hypothetical protein